MLDITMVENYLPGLLLAAVLVAGISLVPLSYSDYPPPLRQIRDGGANPEDVQCNDGLVHAVRANGARVCVRDATAERLGWEVFVAESAPPDKASFGAILASGTVESVPSTEGKRFWILIEPDIVTGADIVPGHGLFFTLTPNSGEESLRVKIPKDFPTLAVHTGTLTFDDPIVVIADGEEVPSERTESDCFDTYTIPVQNSTLVELLYAYAIGDEPYIVSRSIDVDCPEQMFDDRSAGDYNVILKTSSSTEFVDDGREITGAVLEPSAPPYDMYDTIMNSEINPGNIGPDNLARIQSTSHEEYSVNPGIGFDVEDWMPTHIIDGQRLLYADTGCYRSGDCYLEMQFVPTTFVLNENVHSHALDFSKGYLVHVEYEVKRFYEIDYIVKSLRKIYESEPGAYGGFVNMTRDGKTVWAYEGGQHTFRHYQAVLNFDLNEHTWFGVKSKYHTLDEIIPVFESMGN